MPPPEIKWYGDQAYTAIVDLVGSVFAGAAEDIKELAQHRSPVDTGHLRRNIEVTTLGEGFLGPEDEPYVAVGVDIGVVPYAQIQEDRVHFIESSYQDVISDIIPRLKRRVSDGLRDRRYNIPRYSKRPKRAPYYGLPRQPRPRR